MSPYSTCSSLHLFSSHPDTMVASCQPLMRICYLIYIFAAQQRLQIIALPLLYSPSGCIKIKIIPRLVNLAPLHKYLLILVPTKPTLPSQLCPFAQPKVKAYRDLLQSITFWGIVHSSHSKGDLIKPGTFSLPPRVCEVSFPYQYQGTSQSGCTGKSVLPEKSMVCFQSKNENVGFYLFLQWGLPVAI